jgi:hypothetical protein
MRGYLDQLASTRYRTLLDAATASVTRCDTASTRTATRLRSAAGPSSGRSFVARLDWQAIGLCDRVFKTAALFRLGLPHLSLDGTCQNTTQENEQCTHELDVLGDHACTCPAGPFRTLKHDDVSDIICGFIEEAGGLARRDAYVPELCSSILQRVDVTGAGTDIGDVILDVTVRHPCAARYQPHAARTTGHTLTKAEQEKEVTYPAAGGRSCTAFALETWGRISLAAEDIL